MKICRKLKDLTLLNIATSAFLSMVFFTLFGCSSADKIDASTAEGAYKLAEQYEKDERFEEAVVKYSDVKNKHPYSRFATMAELKTGDIQFKREAYIEAQFAYQTFKDLHPKHPQIDYVTFRLGLSLYNQLPDTIDRDLSIADKAILYFDEVITSYPQSEHLKESREKKAAAIKMLAEKELYIGSFYYKKRQFDSALGRYEGLVRNYLNIEGIGSTSLLGAARSAKETGDRDKVSRFVNSLLSKYPESNEATLARSEFQ